MNPLIRPWLPPRLPDLVIEPEDEPIYDDADSGRTGYYSWYRWVASIVQPDVVLEVGVRLGYSGWALAHADPSGTFVGFDNESYVAGSNERAAKRLRTRYRSVQIHRVDTRRIDSLVPYLDGRTPQVIHIDGDHAFEPCLHDLRMAHEVLHAGGVLIVDDASLPKEPALACQHFLQEHPDYGVMILNDSLSFRGHHILIRLS